jgi:hypothetical protein
MNKWNPEPSQLMMTSSKANCFVVIKSSKPIPIDHVAAFGDWRLRRRSAAR